MSDSPINKSDNTIREYRYPDNGERYIRINVIPATSATVTLTAIYEKTGWRKWLAKILGKPIIETKPIISEVMYE